MTKCTQESFNFPDVKKRTVEVSFKGGDITSDGGVMLLRQVDKRIGLSKAVAQVLEDDRRQASCQHDSLWRYCANGFMGWHVVMKTSMITSHYAMI